MIVITTMVVDHGGKQLEMKATGSYEGTEPTELELEFLEFWNVMSQKAAEIFSASLRGGEARVIELGKSDLPQVRRPDAGGGKN